MPRKVVIWGGTELGAGLAQKGAAGGDSVILIEPDAELLDHAKLRIIRSLEALVNKDVISAKQRRVILDRIRFEVSPTACHNFDVAIETVKDDLDSKKSAVTALSSLASPKALMATTTSLHSVSKIAASCSHPARLVGYHIPALAPTREVVEVVKSEATNSAAVQQAVDLAMDWEQTPIRVADSPGFVVDRLARRFFIEAMLVLNEGVGGVDEVDVILRDRAKFTVGPFEWIDRVGIDTSSAVGRALNTKLENASRFAPLSIEKTLIEAGHLGLKSNRGFFGYVDGYVLPAYCVDRQSFSMDPMMRENVLTFAVRVGAAVANSTEQYILARLLAVVINEAGLLFHEKVASPGDIDIACLSAPILPKGPLAWSDDIGHRTVAGLMHRLSETFDPARYHSAPIFARRA